MSDINDLIARNSQIAYEIGMLTERRRMIKILETLPPEFIDSGYAMRVIRTGIKRINAEQVEGNNND
jgi:hypothetical protein